MGMIAADYLEQMCALLPRGPAWSAEMGSSHANFLDGLAQEFARIDATAMRLIEEADPRTSVDMFAEWERITGLPDPCVLAFSEGDQTFDQRRFALVSKWTSLVGMRAEDYVELARQMGYTITVTEYTPHDVTMDVNASINSAEWAYVLQFNSPLNTLNLSTVNSFVTDPLASWGNSLLECVLERAAPGHAIVIFVYQ